MIIETIKLNEIEIFPELFLGICIIYIFFYGTFVCYNSQFNYAIIQTSLIYLTFLIFVMVSFLLANNSLKILNSICFNSTVACDYLGFVSKFLISVSSLIFFLMVQEYLFHQKINYFEYILIFLFAILGIFLLCSSNDLLSAYLSIELQSLAFYILAALKKNSTYSIEAGLKYFVLGAFSSGLFLFGSSLIYGITGSINFADFKDLFFEAVPGHTTKTLIDVPLINRIEIVDSKLSIMVPGLCYLSEYDIETLIMDYQYLLQLVENPEYKKYFFNPIEMFLTEPFFPRDIYTNIACILQESTNTQYLKDIEIERYFRTKNSDIYNLNCFFSFCWLTNVLNKCQILEFLLLEQAIIPQNNQYDIFVYPCNILKIAELSKEFIELDDYQIKNYFYNYKAFDVNILQFAIVFVLISIFFKLAIAPFHTWSPDIYEGSPTSTTFFFVVVPKLGIFILLLRIFYFGFFNFIDNCRNFIILVAILSIIIGSVAGLEQRKFKSLLAYSSISHMGYILISFSTGNIEGIQMLFNYIMIYVISGLCIWSVFVLTKLKSNYTKKQNKDLGDLILLHKSNTMLALILSITLFSIAGLPPTIGFLVKMSIFLSTIKSSMYIIALISVLFSVIATFYYIRIVKILYFEPILVGKLYYPVTTSKSVVLVFLFYLFLFLFLNPTVLYLFSYKLSLMF